MRTVQHSQMQIGEVDITRIEFDPRSRHDIPRILRGLQHVYTNAPLREAIFSLLDKHVAPTVNKQTGRPGMELWKILVCGVVLEIARFMSHARCQMDQIRRRVTEVQTIPHAEKVFSIFEPHTEWISKGKAGVSQELGLRVAILEDQYQFILHHQVMEKQTDDSVALSIVTQEKKTIWVVSGE